MWYATSGQVDVFGGRRHVEEEKGCIAHCEGGDAGLVGNEYVMTLGRIIVTLTVSR